jgi:hypothetical protein
MSAVRMVAYGVIEINERDTRSLVGLSHQSTAEIEELIAKERADQLARDEIYKLVSDEIARYGLLLMRNVGPVNKYRSEGEWVLNSPKVLTSSGWVLREELCIGTYKECCIKAAKYLDARESLNSSP